VLDDAGGLPLPPGRPAAADGGAAAAPAAWLGGSVVDRRDHPVPEARVLAFPVGGRRGTPFETATDLSGHFRLAAPAARPVPPADRGAGFPPTEKTP
jgi:hypothetical protein